MVSEQCGQWGVCLWIFDDDPPNFHQLQNEICCAHAMESNDLQGIFPSLFFVFLSISPIFLQAFNTFVDDVFACMIDMPTTHRLATLRDDLVFFVYLYQRMIYPVDKKRANEYGFAYEKGEGEGEGEGKGEEEKEGEKGEGENELGEEEKKNQ